MENSENTQNDENEEIIKNTDVELKEYKILSRFFDKNEEGENIKEIELPTVESLGKLCSSLILKDMITFDKDKFKLFLEIKNENSDTENIIFNLDKVVSIKNRDLVAYLLIFLGGINTNTDIYIHFEEDTVPNASEEKFIDNCSNYFQYLISIIDYLKNIDKIPDPSTLKLLYEALEEIGVKIHKDEKNVLYKNINDAFFTLDKNKILIILTPSNNFWVKSEKKIINNQYYDIELNNYCNIFYNKKFIKKFLDKVTKHPRCVFGLLCSMTSTNLKKCWEALERQFSQDCPNKVILFPQHLHEKIVLDPKEKPIFLRKMNKIIEHLKQEKESENQKSTNDNNEGNNLDYFNEKNILILENDKEKWSETEYNSIYVNLFNENYLELNEEGKETIDLEGDRVINYIIKLFENCNDDIRVYINKNKYP